MRIGQTDIVLPTMMVGNYPKPRWFTGQAWGQIPIGRYPADSVSYEAFHDAILAIVNDQEEAGLDVITDGLMVSGDSPYFAKLLYLAERIEGYVCHGPSILLPTYSKEFSPIIRGKATRRCPIYAEQAKVLRKLTDRPIKVNFPGLQALVMCSANQYYSDVRDLAFDLARIYNEEFTELAAAGVDIIQIDELSWHFGLSFGDWEADVFNTAVEGVAADIVVHCCWGNYMGTPAYLPSGPAHGQAPDREGDEYVLTLRERGAGTGRAAAIFPRAQQLNLTALNYEIAHQGVADLRALEKAQWRKPFVAGVIDVKSLEVDQVTDVADRIRACLEVVPADMLGLTTDCGLINMPRQIAQAKLRALVEGARLVRAELGAAREELLVG